MIQKKIIKLVGISFFILSISPLFFKAKADDLLIKNNGQVFLIILSKEDNTLSYLDNGKRVLGANITPYNYLLLSDASSAVTATLQITPFDEVSSDNSNVNANKENKSDNSNNANSADKGTSNENKKSKIEVTLINTDNPPSMNTNNSSLVTKLVDQVVVDLGEGTPPLVIATKGNSYIIKQESVEVHTNLPIEVDTQKKVVSVVTSKGPQPINVSPLEIMSVVSKNDFVLSHIAGKITIVENKGEAVTVVQGREKLKVFNLFEMTSPTTINISAENGKILNISQSFVVSILKFVNNTSVNLFNFPILKPLQ